MQFWKCDPNTITTYVSIVMPCYNTHENFLRECFESISIQHGIFGVELVIINDGSDTDHTDALERQITIFKYRKYNLSVVYLRLYENKGVSYCLKRGVLLASHELIVRMDSDDIMHESRITMQIEFMNENPDCVVCGSNMVCFNTDRTNTKQYMDTTHHPDYLTWENYKTEKKQWILNHPTLILRKSAILSVGNYNENIAGFEDLDLELRLLKKYGHVRNIVSNLLLYRCHESNTTVTNKIDGSKIQQHIDKIVSENDIL